MSKASAGAPGTEAPRRPPDNGSAPGNGSAPDNDSAPGNGPTPGNDSAPNIGGGTNPAPAEWHPFHPERRDKVEEAERVLLRALPRVQDAADGAVRGRVSIRHDPMAAIEEMLLDEPFDEIVLSVAPHPRRWLHPDLARRVARLGLPVTVVHEDPSAAG